MDVAIVILNWNGRSLLERFVPVLLNNIPKENCFVVVADNASTDDSLAWLEANYPQVETVELDRNYGFAGGYNRALQEIEADYYVLLNSDVEVTPLWLDTLVAFMEDNPDVGICQPKIRSYAKRDYFEYAGAAGGYIDRYGYPFCRGRILSKIEKDSGQYDEPEQCFWASGACLMIRSDLYHYLGGMDETFFAHMEEIDLCWRAKLAGHQVWAVPEAVVYHIGGAALDQASPQKLYLNYRNSLLMLQKNLPVSDHRKIMAIRNFLDFCASMVYLFTGRWSYFKAVWRAKRDFRKMLCDVEVSSFSEDGNDVGRYPGSIIARYLRSLGTLTFDRLRF
ncbi:MAG: glycosyltransferase family 2 protein [Bacteroidales bacterium]|nr:glycosyltransferase family 2 protein [Bacteroidales bacterium]